jgi:hypothetical protein
MWSFTRSNDIWATLAVAAIAIGAAAFLLTVGFAPDRLPFPTNSPYSDAAISHWPNALYLKSHPFARWNPRIYSGIPFAANPLSKVYYPPQWLVYLLPPALHLNLLTWLHLALAGAGMWAWARSTGMQPGPAALATAAYALSPKVIAHLGAGHLDLLYAAGWFPWLLWAVHRLVRIDARAPRGVLRLSAIAALALLADVRLSFYALITAGAYGLWLIWTSPRDAGKPRNRTLALHILVTANAAALVLTAAQWAPLANLAPYLSRGSITAEDAGAFSLEAGNFAGLVLGQRAGNQEQMVYAGLAVLVLAIIAFIIRPRAVGFWAGVVVVAALWSMGERGLIWPLAVRVFPPLLWFRVPSRAWFVAAIALPYMAGWGAQYLTQSAPGKRARLAVTALLASMVVCGASSSLLLTEDTDGALDPAIASTALVLSIVTAVVIGLAMSFAAQPGIEHTPAGLIFTVLLAAIVIVDLAAFGGSLVEWRGRDEWLDPYEELALYLKDVNAGRVYSPSYSLPQQAAAYWEIDTFGGIDPFQIESYVEMSARATGTIRSSYAPTIPPYTGEVETAWAGVTPDAELLSLWNVTHAVSAFPIEGEGWALDAQIGDVYVYRNTHRTENLSSDALELPDGATAFQADGGAYVWISIPYTPNWSRGEPSDAPHALTRYPNDSAPVEYDASIDIAGAAVSLLALAAWLYLYWQQRHKKHGTERTT